MLSAWFAHSVFLWTLLTLPVAQALLLFAHLRRTKATAQLASALRLRRSVLLRPDLRRWKSVCFLTGILLLALACAGPQWGIDRDAQQRKGRDVILVLDLSRSMDAGQPSRRELAVRALRDLADAFEEHGGNRVALIAFASQPQLLFPLTQDCDHLRHTLGRIENGDVPKLSVEEPVSGTRIGAALKLAVASYDPIRANRPVIVLLSDGDDPVEDDEWLEGVAAAKEKRASIHTVGIGDPYKEETIPAGSDVLRYNGIPVRTKLVERRLREIATRTGGAYLPAHTDVLSLGAFVLHLLDADELRPETPSDDALPIYQLRYAWFLFPAVLLFMLAMCLNEGPPQLRKESKMPRTSVLAMPRRARAMALLIVVLAILGISAAAPSAEDVVRQADDAFARQDYAGALKLYEKAEPLTLDPGLISFNRAAAHYRLGQHKEAIECYRRCLQDDAASAERRARAHFDLGNALVEYACIEPYQLTEAIAGFPISISLNRSAHGNNPTLLAEAVAEYRACLHQPNLPAELRADARFNLELAQLLWLKARERLTAEQKNPGSQDKPTYPDKDKPGSESYVAVDPAKEAKMQQVDDAPTPSKSKKFRSQGDVVVLPDDERVQPITPENTLATLAHHVRRIAADRRGYNNPKGPAMLTTKDW